MSLYDTPLANAVASGKHSAARMLLEAGAEVNEMVYPQFNPYRIALTVGDLCFSDNKVDTKMLTLLIDYGHIPYASVFSKLIDLRKTKLFGQWITLLDPRLVDVIACSIIYSANAQMVKDFYNAGFRLNAELLPYFRNMNALKYTLRYYDIDAKVYGGSTLAEIAKCRRDRALIAVIKDHVTNKSRQV